MSDYDDDAPILNGTLAEWTLEIVSDSLNFGENWESLDKRKAASEWITQSRYTFQTKRQKEADDSIIPFESSGEKKKR